MLDPVTIDQMRMLIAVADAGNFSAAARKLKRVQSAVSTSMANLEAQLGITIWDRSSKIAVLTDEGRAVLARAKRVVSEMDALRAFSLELSRGLEARVSICVDALFPTEALVESCASFTEEFPTVDLHVDVQTMSSVSLSVEGGALYEPDTDRAFVDELRKNLDPEIQVVEVDTHINTPEFGQAVGEALRESFRLKAQSG